MVEIFIKAVIMIGGITANTKGQRSAPSNSSREARY